MTLPELFRTAVLSYPNNALLWEKTRDSYTPISYAETYKRVREIAGGLLSAGIRKNDKVVLLSEGRNDWIISELAVLFAGGVCVPVSIKIDEPGELKFRIEHSDSRFIIVSGRQLFKIDKLRNELSLLEKIIVIDNKEFSDSKFISLTDLIKLGIEFNQTYPYKLDEATTQIKPDDVANICYTSGTTADPKGIMLTHRNYTANAEQSCTLFDVPEWYVSLMILPWDHSFAHTVGIYTLMKNGASIASVQLGKTALESLKNIPINIREIKPVFLLSVPALARSFKNNIEKSIRDKGHFTQFLFKTALKTAYFYNSYGFDKGKGLRAIARPLNALFDIILFKKIRDGFGGKLKFFVGGGALLDMEFQRFFYAIGIPMVDTVDTFKAAGREREAALLTADFLRHGDRVVQAGLKLPPHEVNYEQTIVGPAVLIALECYLLTREARYLDGARQLLPALDAFNGRQPDHHLYDIAIRHWDGFWFGGRRTWGDTFPHYWSAASGWAFYRYWQATGDETYRRRGREILLNNLSAFRADGSACCVYIYPDAVNGNPGRFWDPLANDQDWAMVFLMQAARLDPKFVSERWK